MPTPSLKPLPTLPFNAPAGQAGAWGLFDAPLVGRPEPMGATVDATLVRVWPAVGPALKSPTPTARVCCAPPVHVCSMCDGS